MTIPSLQLELPKFESLTAGTDLPQVPPEEIESPPHTARLTPIFAEPEKTKAPNLPPVSSTSRDEASTVTPPQSPGRPTSMRRFLSRVSLNSSYNHQDDKASVFSAPTTSMSSPESNGKKPKKSSWWKKSSSSSSKRHSTAFPLSSQGSSAQPKAKATVQSIPPPPRLPDDMFGNSLSSMDNDMFKHFK
jgi:hypothetical protein